MSADAASLPCPICSHTGVFDSVQTLRDRLISVSTNKLLCPVCQEEVFGLDKLTIHLFSHVKLITTIECRDKGDITDTGTKPKIENQALAKTQHKKPKPTLAKNKTVSTTCAPVKFVKIYPKLPVISLNTVPIIDVSRGHTVEECAQAGSSIYVPATVKTETALIQTNTSCNVCGLQFVDANILRMHRCLIHNIDENSSQSFTRYNCHLCPKNFKMRGSLMVHLRVAHYGFSSGSCAPAQNTDKISEKSSDQVQDEQPVNFDRNDNKQWQCEVCRKCFTTKYFLKKHKRLHTGETPYACTQCNKTFTFQQSYHKHLLYHNDEKPHTCNYCGRAFKELSTLHNHQRIHTGEKPFSCETCGKCFRQRVSYLVHRRIHTGAMPYRCTACEKSFRYKVSQRTHKCQAQPPGTVVRQTGHLVEKLKKKHATSNNTSIKSQNLPSEDTKCSELYAANPRLNSNSPEVSGTHSELKSNYLEVSEANAELVRKGAKLSLEDMESENFTLISEMSSDINNDIFPGTSYSAEIRNNEVTIAKNLELYDSNIEDLINYIPAADKNVPSPSEIFKNLCLSTDEDYIGILNETDDEKNNENSKEFDIFL